jgi:hypothetical protein
MVKSGSARRKRVRDMAFEILGEKNPRVTPTFGTSNIELRTSNELRRGAE